METTQQAVVRLDNVRKVYSEGTPAEVQALRGISLEIQAGEFVAFMGASGSGKTTLMNLIGCLDTPSSGHVFCDGVDVGSLPAEKLARLRLNSIGFVFQSFQLLTRLSALSNVMMPLAYAGVPRNERKPRAEQVLASVGLAERGAHLPTELSGGQQQRVAIARALINNPRILLADEPTGALDSHTGAEVMELFEQLHRSGRTIILITHDAHVAEHAQRIITIADGQMIEDKRR